MKQTIILLLLINSFCSNAQTAKVKTALFDGIVVAGYVNKGAYLNFAGPGLKLSKGHSQFMLGMFPSLRFKKDRATPANSFVTPALGVGVTYTYKALALQVPLYYNNKTGSQNGQWYAGLGVGLRLNGLTVKKTKNP